MDGSEGEWIKDAACRIHASKAILAQKVAIHNISQRYRNSLFCHFSIFCIRRRHTCCPDEGSAIVASKHIPWSYGVQQRCNCTRSDHDTVVPFSTWSGFCKLYSAYADRR